MWAPIPPTMWLALLFALAVHVAVGIPAPQAPGGGGVGTPPPPGQRYAQCQNLDAKPAGPGGWQAGCPPNTVYVSATDARAQFKSVSAAVQAMLPKGGGTLLIGRGTYNERVILSQGDWIVLGQTTVAASHRSNVATITWSEWTYRGLGKPNMAVSTFVTNTKGSVKVYNLNILNTQKENWAVANGVAPAVFAGHGGRYSFVHCSLRSLQDTVCAQGKFFAYGGEVLGTVDFIYGDHSAGEVAVFMGTTLGVRACRGAAIVAMRAPIPNTGGFFCLDCHVARSWDAIPGDWRGKCNLARPWSPNSRAVFVRTLMDDVVSPVGFTEWQPGTTEYLALGHSFFAEVNCRGPGYQPQSRDPKVSKVLVGLQYDAQYSATALMGSDPLAGL